MGTGEGQAASERVQRLQTALHAKAKEAPGFRFYSLSDRVWREDVVAVAWQAVRRNGGSAGVDGEMVADVESRGVDGWLGALARDLKAGTYRPQAVRPASVQSICRRLSALTTPRDVLLRPEVLVGRLNRLLTGWANDFTLGQVSPAYEAVDRHATRRLRRGSAANTVADREGSALPGDAALAGRDVGRFRKPLSILAFANCGPEPKLTTLTRSERLEVLGGKARKTTGAGGTTL